MADENNAPNAGTQDNAAQNMSALDFDSFDFTNDEVENTPATTEPASTETTQTTETPAASTQTPETNADGTPVTPQTPATTPPAGTQQPDAAVKPMTQAEIDAKIAEGVAAAIAAQNAQAKPAQQQQQEPPKPLTDEEKRKLFNVWEPTQQDVDDIVEGGETALKALARVRDGLAKQTFTMAKVYADNAIQQFQQSVQPYIQMAQNLQHQQESDAFYKANPDLAGHSEIVDAIFVKMKAAGQKFPTIDEAYKALGTNVRNVLQKAGIKPTTEQTQTKSESKSKMTPQTSGGQRGTANKPTTNAQTEDMAGAEVFD